MVNVKEKELQRTYRHSRLRKKVIGTTERPRLCIHRSLKNFYVQVVDDEKSKVLFGISTMNKDVKSKFKYGGNVNAAKVLGEAFAQLAQKQGIKKVSFDRGGLKYHGRIKAFAEAARSAGMEF